MGTTLQPKAGSKLIRFEKGRAAEEPQDAMLDALEAICPRVAPIVGRRNLELQNIVAHQGVLAQNSQKALEPSIGGVANYKQKTPRVDHPSPFCHR